MSSFPFNTSSGVNPNLPGVFTGKLATGGSNPASLFFQQNVQNYRTYNLVNRNAALYALRLIRGQSKNALLTFYFPISPQDYQKILPFKNSYYDVQGQPGTGYPKTSGIQRIIDLYGTAPPIIRIGGTTGWQFHSNDGFTASGLTALKNLETILNQFSFLNNAAISQSNSQNYTLEFYDYFRSEYWIVVPIGNQEISFNEKEPLFGKFRLTFASLGPVNAAPVALKNSLLQALQVTASNALNTVKSIANDTLNTLSSPLGF